MRNRIRRKATAGGGARGQRGHTLVELSVIVVVVGLLVGTAITARAMLQSARVKSLAADFTVARTAINAYQDKFRALPGDDPLAASHLPGAFVTAGTGAGNGVIDGRWNSTSLADDSFVFWQHVRLGGFLAGSADPADEAYRPRNPEGGVVGVSSATAGLVQVAGLRGTFQVCSSAIGGALARELDGMLDDGETATGSMRAVPDGAPLGTAAIPSRAMQDGQTYTVCLAF